MNPKVLELLKSIGSDKKFYGIVNFDFPEYSEGLISKIIHLEQLEIFSKCPHCSYPGINFGDVCFYNPYEEINECHLCHCSISIDRVNKTVSKFICDSKMNCPHCHYGGVNFGDFYYYPRGSINECHLCKSPIQIDFCKSSVTKYTDVQLNKFHQWQLCSHRFYDKDIRNINSTFVIIHENPSSYHNLWNILELQNGTVKILLNSEERQDWELCVHEKEKTEREDSESGYDGHWVIIHKPEHHFNNTWKLILVEGKLDVYEIQLIAI
jgi:hypothetical protein